MRNSHIDFDKEIKFMANVIDFKMQKLKYTFCPNLASCDLNRAGTIEFPDAIPFFDFRDDVGLLLHLISQKENTKNLGENK